PPAHRGRSCAHLSTINHQFCTFLLVSGPDVMLRGMTTVCFVGAGSAGFTRQLLRDLLSYDDLGPLTLVLHDVDERRLRLARDLALPTLLPSRPPAGDTRRA